MSTKEPDMDSGLLRADGLFLGDTEPPSVSVARLLLCSLDKCMYDVYQEHLNTFSQTFPVP